VLALPALTVKCSGAPMLARSLAQHTDLARAVTDKLAETKKSDQAKKELHKLELQAQKAKKQEVRAVALSWPPQCGGRRGAVSLPALAAQTPASCTPRCAGVVRLAPVRPCSNRVGLVWAGGAPLCSHRNPYEGRGCCGQEEAAAKAVFKLGRSFGPASKRAAKETREARLPPRRLVRSAVGRIRHCCNPCPSSQALHEAGANSRQRAAGQETRGAQAVWGGVRAWHLEVQVRPAPDAA